MRAARVVILLLSATMLLATGCETQSSTPATPGASKVSTGTAQYDLGIPMVTYTWDPQAGDPAVSAELGGPGFTGEGWVSNLTFPAIGSPEAIKGGSMTRYVPDWPATLRQMGKNWNSTLNYMIRDIAFPRLLDVHPVTLEFIPGIATHWWIAEDKMTYRFRINPKARWSDGKEIVAQDVVATLKLRLDPTLLDPSNILTFSKLEPPTAVSKYIVEVKVREENWRNFLYFAGATILPAHQASVTGTEYLDEYQFSFTSFCGPYWVNEADIVSGEALTVRRNPKWWDADNPAWVGLYNIDAYKFIVVKDVQLAFEKVKRGEIDYYNIPKAEWWAKELPENDLVKRGLIARTKFYTDAPVGTAGLALNMTRKPLDNLNLRKAIGHLFNRKLMIEKLFFNEYKPLNSYWQGGTYQNPDNEMVEYDEFGAVELLQAAGWNELNAEGYRVKDGKTLALKVMYRSRLSEPSLTVMQESCKKAGIKLELDLLTPSSFWKNLQEKEYEVAYMNWGAIVFPNPETSFHSKLADQKNNNNVTGFKNERVDELCTAYDREYDVQKRRQIIREIDGLVHAEHPYALGWYNPAQRIVYWNKFSYPKWGGGRVEDYDEIHFAWWVDPEKEKALEAAKQDSSLTLPKPPLDNRFWGAWNEAQRKGKVSSSP